VLALPLSTCTAPISYSAQDAKSVDAQASKLEPSIFGEPIVVYGRQITDDEIKRCLCFGLGRPQVGYSPVDMFKFAIVVDQELARRKNDEYKRLKEAEVARRKAAGEASPDQLGPDVEKALMAAAEASLKKFEITDEMNQKRLERDKADFVLRYPTLDFRTEVGRSFLSLELYMEHQKHMLQFDNLFIPDNPDYWPELTTQVVLEFGGQMFVDDAKESHVNRRQRKIDEGLASLPTDDQAARDRYTQETIAAVEDGKIEIQPDDPIFTDTLRQLVLQALNNYAVVHSDIDQIEADLPEAGADSSQDPAARAKARHERARAVLATVEGKPIMIEDVWSRIAPFATEDLVDDVKRFLVLNALLERDLQQKGVLMTPAQFREWWPTTAPTPPNAPPQKMGYQEFLNNHEMLSSQVLGFPSLYHYALHTRIEESYRKAIADELKKDDNLIPLLPKVNQIAGAAKINIESILVSAYDFANVKWKQNGWADAKKKSLELKKQLDGGAEWTPILELHSEFWDPPMPEVGNKPQFGFLFKGKFGEQTRNQLLSYLGESQYRIYMYGQSITDHAFFDQKMGSIEGPFLGPRGYYITRVTGKTPFSKPLDIKGEPIHRQIAEQHYLQNSMNARASELLAQGLKDGKVKGVKGGGGINDL
jgi:hypothetical protein